MGLDQPLIKFPPISVIVQHVIVRSSLIFSFEFVDSQRRWRVGPEAEVLTQCQCCRSRRLGNLCDASTPIDVYNVLGIRLPTIVVDE